MLPSVKEEVIEESNAIIPKGWAVCEIKEPETKESTITIEISKFCIKSCSAINPNHLTKVCRVLMEL